MPKLTRNNSAFQTDVTIKKPYIDASSTTAAASAATSTVVAGARVSEYHQKLRSMRVWVQTPVITIYLCWNASTHGNPIQQEIGVLEDAVVLADNCILLKKIINRRGNNSIVDTYSIMDSIIQWNLQSKTK